MKYLSWFLRNGPEQKSEAKDRDLKLVQICFKIKPFQNSVLVLQCIVFMNSQPTIPCLLSMELACKYNAIYKKGNLSVHNKPNIQIFLTYYFPEQKEICKFK